MINDDFSLNHQEMQVIFTAVSKMREDCEEMLAETPISDPDRESMLAIFKSCNSVLRKVKKVMADNGLKPVPYV